VDEESGTMSKSEIEVIIIETLQELQAGSGDTEFEITPAVAPLSQLGFFDSLLAIETTLVLEERLGCSCGEDSVFKNKETEEPLTIGEIASRLALKVAA
jgi:acyl carrier protein